MNALREEALSEQHAHYAAKLAYEIDSWDLAQAVAAGENVLVIDARSAEAWGREHIPGARSLPHRTMEPASVAEWKRDGHPTHGEAASAGAGACGCE
jgi:hypothetical protein